MAHLNELIALIQPVVEAMGYRLWGCEWRDHSSLGQLCIYIDQDQGVGSEDCVRVTREISHVLDAHDVMTDRYVLEVSSPGIDRTLFTPEQYRLYWGRKIKVTLKHPKEGRKHFQGQLLESNDHGVRIQLEKESVELPFDLVLKAKLMVDDPFRKN